MKLKHLITTFMMLIVVAFCLESDASASNKNSKETWLWDTYSMFNIEVLNFLTDNDITTVYLQVDKTISNSDYAWFIETMSHNNISVEALDGGPAWDNSNIEELSLWLEQYHAEYPNTKFKAMHLDVEPYLSPLWTTDQNEAVFQYQELIEHAKALLEGTGLELNVDIPFWYDEILFLNEAGEGNLAEWVISKVDGVSVMAYRDTLDALKEITNNEMTYAERYKTPVTLGVETMNLPDESYITFYEEGKNEMNEVLNNLTNYYSYNKYYGGVAIHYVDSYMQLKN